MTAVVVRAGLRIRLESDCADPGLLSPVPVKSNAVARPVPSMAAFSDPARTTVTPSVRHFIASIIVKPIAFGSRQITVRTSPFTVPALKWAGNRASQ